MENQSSKIDPTGARRALHCWQQRAAHQSDCKIAPLRAVKLNAQRQAQQPCSHRLTGTHQEGTAKGEATPGWRVD